MKPPRCPVKNNNSNHQKFDFISAITKTFIQSKLTLVISVTSLLLGLMAVYLTPKEEEPQISVPMIDIQIAAPGFEASEVERKVTEVIERGVWGLDGVEYVYSTSRPHGAIITVRFKVGEPIEPSLVKVHHKLMTLKNELPSNVLNPDVKSYSIDDVPFLVLTFYSDKLNDYELRQKISPIARELSSTPELSRTELLGGLNRSVRVIANPKLLNEQGVSLIALAESVKQNHMTVPAGRIWPNSDTTNVYDIEISGRVQNINQIENIAVGVRGGKVVRVKDVAKVIDGPEERTKQSFLYLKDNESRKSAVSLVFSKRKGTNVVSLAKTLIDRTAEYKKELPADIQMTELRNYGETASAKSDELIEHLLIATISVSILIAIFMGLRASLVVAIAIPVTLALTLAIYYFMGYTLNRVTLFALIFSIGILVDDAIVVVENIERHLKHSENSLIKATIKAVSEVGNPTVLATFTVIAAILPMAFVRGLMGPYMKPIPVGASLAMILSLFVAFIVTPWAAVKLLKHETHKNQNEGEPNSEKEKISSDEKNINSELNHKIPKESWVDQQYRRLMENFLDSKWSSIALGLFTVVLLLGSMSFVYFKSVKVKMLPFDNKNEFQVLLDYDPSSSLQYSLNQSEVLAKQILQNENVKMVQVFGGESAPFSFSGMVKHTFLRKSDYQNDLHIVLKDKSKRKQSSHEIIESLRPVIKQFSEKNKVISKVLEIPPGPPVMATMLAEVYGPDKESRKKAADTIENIFKSENSFVDIDTTFRTDRPRKIYEYDQIKGGDLGGRSQNLAYLGSLLFNETVLFSLNQSAQSELKEFPEEIQVRLSVENSSRSSKTPFKNLNVPSFESGTVNAENLLLNEKIIPTENLYRKNLKPVSYVMSELSGSEEAPVYGMLKIADKIPYPTQTAETPWDTKSPVIKWDGEWFITYEVFRDLGGAFAVVMILIYILVLGWFKSFTVPLIIMAPIPISLIGIIPGHWFTGAYFTATSMIGFIAGAGIIVRNSIILVDFIEHQLEQGMGLKLAVVSAGVLRFRPMILTAAAVVVGSAVMIFDPIFQGLAVSLMFGEVAATLISRITVPVLYFWFVGKGRQKLIQQQTQEESI